MNRVNPYWIINEMSNTSKKNRLISSASISYKITDKLKFKLSGGADITEFSFEDFAPISTPSHESGYLKTQTNSNRTINADAVLTYSTNLGKNMSLVGTAGLNLYRVDNFQTTITGKDMAEPEIKKINSFSDKTIVESPYQRQINSAYAMVNLGYKNFAYLDVTVRADNTSTLINTRTCIRRYRAASSSPNCYRRAYPKSCRSARCALRGPRSAMTPAPIRCRSTTHFIRIRSAAYRRVRSPTRPYPTAISNRPGPVRGRSAPSSTS